ncbi:MAG: chorismate dehydratase [Gammaproteobacteria bacterium]|jgi:chorismate dehydratase
MSSPVTKRRPLRVGSVPYLVGRPLDLGLGELDDIELHHAVPAKLVAGLRDGSVDVAMVSSIELFRQPGYGYINGIAVAGESEVTSVQVFPTKPLGEVRSVALDPASRTAATLTQVIWPADLQRPEFIEVAFGQDPREAGADAWLRIGDLALREHIDPSTAEPLNPSRAWRELTGLPFIFAPWIIAPGVDIEPYLDAFVAAHQRGKSEIENLARSAAEEWSVPFERTLHYLSKECLFEPGERQGPAQLEFRDRAAALGLARPDLEPFAVELPAASRVHGE